MKIKSHPRGFRQMFARVVFATAGVVAAAPDAPVVAAQPPFRRDVTAPDDDPDDDAIDDSLDAPDDDAVDDSIASIAASVAPAHAAGRVALLLARMNPFDATHAAALTALSSSARVRQVLADAMCQRFPLVGDDMILDELVTDEDAAVRAAARRAMRIRSVRGPAGDVA